MWIVYNLNDTPFEGFEVATEAEALEMCREDGTLTYTYIEVIESEG